MDPFVCGDGLILAVVIGGIEGSMDPRLGWLDCSSGCVRFCAFCVVDTSSFGAGTRRRVLGVSYNWISGTHFQEVE
jgi:hypothetical protein